MMTEPTDPMRELADEYRIGADLLVKRIDELKLAARRARGADAAGIQRRIELLYEELREVLGTVRLLSSYYSPTKRSVRPRAQTELPAADFYFS